MPQLTLKLNMKSEFPILASALVLLLATIGCGNSKDVKAAAPQAMPVKVLTTKSQKVDDSTDYVATLKSRDSAVVMPQVEGIITQIFVHSGERVAAGTPMVQIDPQKQQATLKSQESATAAQIANGNTSHIAIRSQLNEFQFFFGALL